MKLLFQTISNNFKDYTKEPFSLSVKDTTLSLDKPCDNKRIATIAFEYSRLGSELEKQNDVAKNNIMD